MESALSAAQADANASATLAQGRVAAAVEAEAAVAKLRGEVARLECQIVEARAEAAQARTALSDALADNSSLSAMAEAAQKDGSSAQSNMVARDLELAAYQQQVARLESQREASREGHEATIKSLQDMLDKAELSSTDLARQMSDAKDEVWRLDRELTKTINELQEAKQQANVVEARLASATQELLASQAIAESRELQLEVWG